MSHLRLLMLPCALTLASCATDSDRHSIGTLRSLRADLSDVAIDASTEKAMRSYQKFLEVTPETAMTPEAMRRLADLKIQQEYGTVEGVTRNAQKLAQLEPRRFEPQPSAALPPPAASPFGGAMPQDPGSERTTVARDSSQAVEARASQMSALPSTATPALVTPDGSADAQQGSTEEAVRLYQRLLSRYPHYERNDQVLYQLARAHEELGQVDEAMRTMERIPRDYPKSRYYDEVQFRIGEYHFTRKKYLDAEDAYKAVVQLGPGSSFHELALYKLGWTFYKQELYEDALHRFVALLDHKVQTGYDFDNPQDPLAHKRIEDTHHVISLSFSNLGGADAVMAYFKANGKRSYEAGVYGNLGEHYLEKRRYNDAAIAYRSFVTQNPYHRLAPHYDTRVIDIYKKGGFPKLVIDANKAFVVAYGLKSPYWEYFDIQANPDVVGYVKTSLKELASHYHALYQEKKFEKEQPANFAEAMRWYGEFLASFPKEAESPALHFQMASLLLENKTVGQAAIEFERTAYDYPTHEKAAEAGYAAVYAHRLHLASPAGSDPDRVKQDIIRSSLKFAETFPQHEKAPLVMSAALDDLYAMKDYRQAVTSSRRLIALFPGAEQPVRRTAWLILAHASFELANYREAEEGYLEVLPLTAESDKSRPELVENLAASIYQQGDEANKKADYRTAAGHFLRVARAAPSATILPTAEYDGATALIQLKDWGPAADVLRSFRGQFPSHKLQPEVTKKLAHIYREDGKLSQAAVEYERIETETRDPELRSAALMMAGDLYLEAREEDKALGVYRRYLAAFPRPLDVALESRQKIAGILKGRGDMAAYQAELTAIVQADASAGSERTDRTRYLGATSLLILTEPVYERYALIKLRKPFEDNLKKKQAALREVRTGMEKILDYEISETSAAATYYLGEMYLEFSRALNESERPDDLKGEEKEQYELALEEQAFPFEERAINVHKKNSDFVTLGIWNRWVEKSYAQLAKLVPAHYARFEESTDYIDTFDRVIAYDERIEPMPGVVEFPLALAKAAPAGPADDKDNTAPAAAGTPQPAASLAVQDSRASALHSPAAPLNR